MRKVCLTAVLLASLQCLCAQDFPGFRAGNYTGVNGVFFNPASIADSRYRFSFNLLSASTMVGNNRASFKLKDLTESFDTEELKNQFIGTGAGLSTGFVNADIHGPSLMFNVSKKAAVALTTRLRTTANIIDVDGQVAGRLLDDLESDVSLPYTIASGANMRLKVNAWAEIGATYAQVLKDDGAHFVKGGLTLKYLGGVANGYLQLDGLQGTLNEDGTGEAYLQNTTGRIDIGFGGIQLSDLENIRNTKIESTGFGGDLGLVYEYRPNHEAFRTGDEGDWRRDRNKYLFKVGVALLDVGRINYNRDAARSGGYDLGITGAERFFLNELSDKEIDAYKDYFNSKPEFFTPVAGGNSAKYKVSLPATLQVDVDYHLHRGFYASLAAQLPLAKDDTYNALNYTSITLTPRYEGRALSFYLPLNYNSLTELNAGVSLRIGPWFVGSGSLLTAALGSSKQADVHIGIMRKGFLHSKVKDRKAKNKNKNT